MSTATATLTTKEVADRLIALCRQGKFEDAIKEFYAPNIVSIEPEGARAAARTEGFENVLAKSQNFGQMVEEVHSNVISEPIVSNDFFSMSHSLDVTLKGMGRIPMNEIAIYKVKDGKIVWEQFCYSPMPMPGQN